MMMMKYCFTSTKTVGLLGTGAQDGHLDFHTAPELRYGGGGGGGERLYTYIPVATLSPPE